jgi:hypothetical protein
MLNQFRKKLSKKGETAHLFCDWPANNEIADYLNTYYLLSLSVLARISFRIGVFFRQATCVNIMFWNHLLYLNISNSKSRVVFSLRAGFFKKIFENRKSFKKSPIVGTLLMKSLRKYLIIINPGRLYCRITGAPFSLSGLLHTLETPILHKFKNPVTGQLVNEEKYPTSPFTPLFFIFEKNHIYTSQKQKKRGRIKRKIYRKLIQKFN